MKFGDYMEIWVEQKRKELTSPQFWRDLLVECVATFALTAIFCMLRVTWDDGEQPSAVKAALGMMLTMTCMTWALWHLSGAHLNPCVTFVYAATGRISIHKAVWYMYVQYLGALCAMQFVARIFMSGMLSKSRITVSATAPQGLLMEIFATCIVVGAHFSSATQRRRYVRFFASVTIGMAVGIGTIIAFPATGAVMNLAITLALEFTFDDWRELAPYFFGQLIGTAIANIFSLLITEMMSEEEIMILKAGALSNEAAMELKAQADGRESGEGRRTVLYRRHLIQLKCPPEPDTPAQTQLLTIEKTPPRKDGETSEMYLG